MEVPAQTETRPYSRQRALLHRSIVVSILLIIAGVLAILLPQIAGLAVNVMVGWLLVFSGVAHFIFAWSARKGGGLFWGILLGILYCFVGAYILLNPIVGLASLTLALAFYLFAEGFLEFVLSFNLWRAPLSGWLLVDGFITVLLGVMIWATWPSNSEWVIGTLVGISILFSGLTRLGLSVAAERQLKAA
jgi:uncharacterized membrane protein HdeD (DUF308 family)